MQRSRILVVCCVAQFMCLLDVSIVNVALPSVDAELGLSITDLQWVVNAYTLALAGFLLLGGRAADLIGRRETFAAGLALMGFASLAGGLAEDGATLVAARAAQGLGAALVAPAGLSILATAFAAGAERNRAFAWWGTLGGLGGATGALAGGLLTDASSWRSVMLLTAPIAVGAALVALRTVPGPACRAKRARSIDPRGALTLSAGLVLLSIGIVNIGQHGPTAAATVAPAAGGAVLLGVVPLVERRLAAAPLVPLHAFRSRALAGALAVVLCLGALTFSMWFLVTLYLQQGLHLSPLQTGAAFAPISLTIVASTRLGSRLSTRIGPGQVAAAGMAVLAAGMLGLSGIDAGGSWARDVLVPSLLCAAGIGCSFVPATIVATEAMPATCSGLVSGLVNTAHQVGGSLGLATLATAAGGPSRPTASEVDGLIEGLRQAFVVGAGIGLTGSLLATVLLVRWRALPARAHIRLDR